MMGAVVWDSSLKVLVEFIVQPEAVQRATTILLNGKLSAKFTDSVSQPKPIPVCLTRPVLNEMSPDLPPAEIVQALSLLKLYRLQEQARLEVTAGDYEQAAEHLSRLATHLLAQGERGLAKTALMEAENIHQKKSFSQQGGKEIKYGTRALLSPGRNTEER